MCLCLNKCPWETSLQLQSADTLCKYVFYASLTPKCRITHCSRPTRRLEGCYWALCFLFGWCKCGKSTQTCNTGSVKIYRTTVTRIKAAELTLLKDIQPLGHSEKVNVASWCKYLMKYILSSPPGSEGFPCTCLRPSGVQLMCLGWLPSGKTHFEKRKSCFVK